MRALSESAARTCEMAIHKKCKCRCAGSCHGLKRTANRPDPKRDDFAQLPRDDPHFMKSHNELAEDARERRIVRSKALQFHYSGGHKAFPIAPIISVGRETMRCPACVLEGKARR